jgi:hypothetical protein
MHRGARRWAHRLALVNEGLGGNSRVGHRENPFQYNENVLRSETYTSRSFRG